MERLFDSKLPLRTIATSNTIQNLSVSPNRKGCIRVNSPMTNLSLNLSELSTGRYYHFFIYKFIYKTCALWTFVLPRGIYFVALSKKSQYIGMTLIKSWKFLWILVGMWPSIKVKVTHPLDQKIVMGVCLLNKLNWS